MNSINLDPRIVRVGIGIDGQTNWYEGLSIEAKGVKVSNTIMGQCDITILNVRREVRDRILQETNPFKNIGKRISVVVEVGRESYGTATLYEGDVFRSNPMPKPDTGVNLKCIQGYFNKAKIVSRSGSELTKLSSIAKWIAEDNGVGLSFQIQDRNIARYSFTGSAQAAMVQFEAIANADVYIDKKTLYVKDSGKPAAGAAIRKLSKHSGLISVEGTEYGCKVLMLFDPVTSVGGQLDLISELNPALNGSYIVRKLPFHITSRDQPFYYQAECDRIS